MKKKVLSILITILALCTCMFTLTACGGNSTVEVTSITLNRSSVTLEIGDTVNLYETIYPSNATDKGVTWSSSNTSVATVSNGIVTAISEGTATITAKTSNNKTATCYITVNPQTIAVNSVSLNITNETIEVGDTLSLSATISPSNATDKSVTWSSSNTSVATVSNGIISAVSTGAAVITVKTNNNLTATCKVTVIPKQILPTAIYLSKTSISLEEGNETNVVATMLPTNATNKAVDWLILDTSIARVDNGKITAVAEGETMLIVTTANGLTATCSIVVTSPFVFELVGGSYALKSYNGTATEVVVPSSYKNKPVTAIGVWEEHNTGFAYCTSIKKIVLPDTIKTLSYGAFYQCYSLEEVNIPNSVELISFYLFYGCNSLKKLSVSLDHYTIFKKYFAKAQYTNGTIEYLSIPSSLETVVVTGTKVGSSAFADWSGLKEVIIPSSVTTIDNYAFGNCTSLTNVVIPDSVTSVGKEAFYNCNSLSRVEYSGTIDQWVQITFDNRYSNPLLYAKNLYINNELVTNANIKTATKINAYAFLGCSSLSSITIPDSVISIGSDAFTDCQIENLTIPITAISDIPKSNLKTVVITSGETIGDSVFTSCSSLTSITIPESVTSIGSDAFSSCDDLTIVNYLGTIDNWVQISFSNGYSNPLSNGADLYINNELVTNANITTATKINAYAFHCYFRLTSVTIDYSATSMGDYAFYNCSNLTSMIIPDSVTSIGSYVFYNCSILTNIIIPNSVKSIGDYAFYKCSSLTSMIIPDSVRSVGFSTFEDCSSLTSITIGYRVTAISSSMFEGCSGLTSVTIPSNVRIIGSHAFEGCSSLTSVTIPSSVTSIGAYAFASCSSLTSIVIPSSVTSIGSDVFSSCNGLTILCKVASKPSGWSSRWNSNCRVVWGFLG